MIIPNRPPVGLGWITLRGRQGKKKEVTIEHADKAFVEFLSENYFDFISASLQLIDPFDLTF